MRRPTTVLVLIAIAVVALALLLRSGDDPNAVSTTTSTEADATQSTTSTLGGCDANSNDCEAVATTSSTTTTTPIGTLPDGVDACDLYDGISEIGEVTSSDLVEASGLALSRATDGVLWSHNDSGDGPILYAFGTDGEDLGSFEIPDAFALDWEDLAAGPGPDGTGAYLYVGDMGDNLGIRGGDVTVWRVPDGDPAELDGVFPESASMVLTMPDGPYDAEALFVDPVDQMIYVATKSNDVTRVFASPLAPASNPQTMELVATLFLDAEVSAADMSPDGGLIALRGYWTVWLWKRLPGESVADALTREPCLAPSPDERQGESITIGPDWTYYTVSEGSNPTVFGVKANP